MLIVLCILYAVGLSAEVLLIHLVSKHVFGVDIPKIVNDVINDMLGELCDDFEQSENNQRDNK
jgi:hypothetical protein